jgi:hypothetical protein
MAEAALSEVTEDFASIAHRLTKIENSIRTHNITLGRIIAKLDPTFAQSEFDPARCKASDEIAAQVLARIAAEQAASTHTLGGDC